MSWRERFQLTWNLTWPLVVINVVWAVFLYVVIGSDGGTADSLFQAVSFFVLGPLVVRWALGRGTGRFRIVVREDGAASSLRTGLSISNALSIFWLLAWRPLVLALLALVPLSLLLKSVVPQQANHLVKELSKSPFANALGLTGVDLIINMAFLPLLIPSMLRKRYKRFSLVLQPRQDEAMVKIVSPKTSKRNLSKR